MSSYTGKSRVDLAVPFYLGNELYYGMWDLPFNVAIDDKLSGTYRIAQRRGGLFVVCGDLIRVSGYMAVSYLGSSYHVSRHNLICLRSVELSASRFNRLTSSGRPIRYRAVDRPTY